MAMVLETATLNTKLQKQVLRDMNQDDMHKNQKDLLFSELQKKKKKCVRSSAHLAFICIGTAYPNALTAFDSY